MLEQFDTITAAFRPRRRDDLRPGSEKCIGVVAKWQAMWLIEDGENSYAGQWAMQPQGDPVGTGLERWPFAWVPECDLERFGED